MTTICVNMMPDYSRAYGFPRIAAIEYPFGCPLGKPGDQEGQLQVIRATLRVLEEIQQPGEVVHLPFEWPDPPAKANWHPAKPSPIAKHIGQGKVADPVGVLGQGLWPDVDAIMGNTPKAQTAFGADAAQVSK